ncbi:MAG TPA: hypothetical protein PKK60_04335 [archaeon]|nr:hypothetical protein [archaeon]
MPQVQNKGKMRTLFKKTSPFFPRARIISRAFRNFSTQEAHTFIVRYGGKRRFLRVQKRSPTKENAAREYAWMKIFNILYPSVSVKPIGITLVKGKNNVGGSTNYGVVSEIVRGLSPAYKKQQKSFYGYYDLLDMGITSQGELSHADFVNKVKNGLAKKIYEESGIKVQTHEVNVGDKKGVPVFFETSLDLTKYNKFRHFVLFQPKEKAEKIIELLEVIRKAKI